MRLFIAVAPSVGARRALQETAAALRAAVAGRYVDPSLFHITLAFMGDVDEPTLPAARDAMECAALGIAPFEVSLARVGRFGTVLWRGLAPETELACLAESVRAELRREGIPFDAKPFRAHVTLARDITISGPLPALVLPDAAFFVSNMIMYESLRGPAGPVYRPRAEVRLR